MKLNVLAKLVCLAGKYDAGDNIQSLVEDEERFDTPYAYYGEFLERQSGYESEKIISYLLLKNSLTAKYINDYQKKDIEKKIQNLNAGNDSFLRMADAVFNNKYNPVPFKDYIMMMKLAFLCNCKIPDDTAYYYFMENFDNIIRCKFSYQEVLSVFCSIKDIDVRNKNLIFFKNLFEKKPTEKRKSEMIALGMSDIDISIIRSILVSGDRKATNARVEAFSMLFESHQEWSDFEKSFVKEFWEKQLPTKFEGSKYLSDSFCSVPLNLQNMFFMVDEYSRFIDRIKIANKNGLVTNWKEIMNHFQSKEDYIFSLLININDAKIWTEIVKCFPDINIKKFIDKFPGKAELLYQMDLISIEKISEASERALKDIIRGGFKNTYELLVTLKNNDSKKAANVVRNIEYDVFLTTRELIELVAEILVSDSMIEFDKFLRVILYHDSFAKDIFSESELSRLVTSYREICKMYNSYRNCSSEDEKWLFEKYATNEEKQSQKEAEDKKKLSDTIEKIRRKLGTNNLFWMNRYDFARICAYDRKLELKVWNILSLEIQDTIEVSTREEYFEMIENISEYADYLNLSIPDFKNYIDRLKIKED